MTEYQEWVKANFYATKYISDFSYFYLHKSDIIGTYTRTEYVKTESGKWKIKNTPHRYKLTGNIYMNYLGAIPLMRNLGGKEIIHKYWTTQGYMPMIIHSISPDRKTKIVTEFKFNK